MMKPFEIYSLSIFEIYNTVLLAIVTTMYISMTYLFILQLEVYTFSPSLPISVTSPSLFLWQPTSCCLYL